MLFGESRKDLKREAADLRVKYAGLAEEAQRLRKQNYKLERQVEELEIERSRLRGLRPRLFLVSLMEGWRAAYDPPSKEREPDWELLDANAPPDGRKRFVRKSFADEGRQHG